MSAELIAARRNAELVRKTSHDKSPQYMLASTLLLLIQHLEKTETA